jgi:hypothetical protein
VSGDANAGVPHLEHNCGSWTIVCRDSGKPVFETFERHIAQAANQVLYEVLTTRQWLVRFNAAVRAVTTGVAPSSVRPLDGPPAGS